MEAPPNVCNPTHMAAAAAHIAKQAPETMKVQAGPPLAAPSFCGLTCMLAWHTARLYTPKHSNTGIQLTLSPILISIFKTRNFGNIVH